MFFISTLIFLSSIILISSKVMEKLLFHYLKFLLFITFKILYIYYLILYNKSYKLNLFNNVLK